MSTVNMLDQWQQVFCMSWLSNAAAGVKLPHPDQDSFLEGLISTKFKNFMAAYYNGNTPDDSYVADWSIVWGPAVFRHTALDLMADNAMFVATCPAMTVGSVSIPAMTVVAIAATNFSDEYDWKQEDFNVKSPVAWPYGTPAGYDGGAGKISAATALGIANLLGLSGACSASQMEGKTSCTLQEFLSQASGLPDLLTVTGHSLAGALSPTLTTALICQGNVSRFGTIRFLATAGATPGDGDFAAMVKALLPPSLPSGSDPAYGAWNCDVINALDVVPHAWDKLAQIPALYGIDFANSKAARPLTCLVGKLENQISDDDYTALTQLVLCQHVLPYSTVTTLPGFITEALNEHIDRYTSSDIFNVAGLFPGKHSWPGELLEEAVAEIVAELIRLNGCS